MAKITDTTTLSMDQSTVMVGALIGAFVLWLAMNGKLATYWSLLIGGTGQTSGTAASAQPQTPTSAAPTVGPVTVPNSSLISNMLNIGQIVNTAATVAAAGG